MNLKELKFNELTSINGGGIPLVCTGPTWPVNIGAKIASKLFK